MTGQMIQKNIKLSMEFDTYAAQHPRVLKSIPHRANVIVTSEKDEKLSNANRAIARNSRSGKFIEARKTGKKWEIKRIK